MNKDSISVQFLYDNVIEISVSKEVFLLLQKAAKAKGVSVQNLLSSELLQVHSVDR
jgi:hypothetical protein